MYAEHRKRFVLDVCLLTVPEPWEAADHWIGSRGCCDGVREDRLHVGICSPRRYFGVGRLLAGVAVYWLLACVVGLS